MKRGRARGRESIATPSARLPAGLGQHGSLCRRSQLEEHVEMLEQSSGANAGAAVEFSEPLLTLRGAGNGRALRGDGTSPEHGLDPLHDSRPILD